MQPKIDDNILRQIDPSQAYLWKWVAFKGKSGGILSGVRMEASFCSGSREPYFVGGDFNLIRFLSEKKTKQLLCPGILGPSTL